MRNLRPPSRRDRAVSSADRSIETTESLRPVAVVAVALLAGGVTLGTLLGKGADRFSDYEPVLAQEAAPGPVASPRPTTDLVQETRPDLQTAEVASSAVAEEAAVDFQNVVGREQQLGPQAKLGELAAQTAQEVSPDTWFSPFSTSQKSEILTARSLVQEENLDGYVEISSGRSQPLAWQENSVEVAAAKGRPRIAIVLDDLGLNRPGTRRAIRLPGPLTLAFLTYADDLPKQTQKAREQGHELLVHMPMAAEKEKIAAKYRPLSPELSQQELQANLDWGLSRFEGYVGINNHMGSRMTKDRPGMTLVMKTLKDRGLLYMDSRTSGRSVGEEVAEEIGVPTNHRDIFLDHEQTDEFVIQQLKKVERIAVKYGQAIAIGHPHKVTLTHLEDWLPRMKAKGYQIVPISALVKTPKPLQLSETNWNAGANKAN